MYDLSDTIVAVSSASGGVRSIVRLTGPQTLSICEQVIGLSPESAIPNSVIVSGVVRLHDGLAIDTNCYLFFAPHSYTGEDLAEIHIHAGPVLVEALVQNLLAQGLRSAGPGEFTARAYLNGKLDLAQAEAVNEVISSSNRLQLEAAERLLSGRLTKAADEIHSALLDVLSLIEAGLDFSGEDITFIGAQEAAERLTQIQRSLEELLASSIRYETLMDLPAVGIAGAPNAGKSSLLNALLGWERSLVSPQAKTTRDVLSGVLTTDRFQCVLFDCAGLVLKPDNTLDELTQRAAVEALQRCAAVLFCVDAAKPSPSDDIAVRSLIQPKSVIHIATKSDLLSGEELSRKTRALTGLFHAEFMPVSSKTSHGLANLLHAVEKSTVGWAVPTSRHAHPGQSVGYAHHSSYHRQTPDSASSPALTARHRQAVTEAIGQIAQAVAQVNRGNEEVAVMMIRAACQAISQIERQPLDEQVLDRIFSRFCIGK
jgi:tRNA modification GTPase